MMKRSQRRAISEVIQGMPRVGLAGGGDARQVPGGRGGAVAVLNEACRQGIRFFDVTKANRENEPYIRSFIQEHGDRRGDVFLAGGSAGRNYDSAMSDLEETLDVLGVRHLDLWQIRDVRSMAEIRAIGKPGGALEAFIDAREAGVVTYTGVTGHYDPGVLTYAVDNWPVDTVALPVNPVEAVLGGFLDITVDAAMRRGIEVIGTRILGEGHYIFPGSGISPEILIRFALSQPVAMVVSGCSSPGEVVTLASAAKGFVPMSTDEQNALVEKFRPRAEKLAFYRGNL